MKITSKFTSKYLNAIYAKANMPNSDIAVLHGDEEYECELDELAHYDLAGSIARENNAVAFLYYHEDVLVNYSYSLAEGFPFWFRMGGSSIVIYYFALLNEWRSRILLLSLFSKSEEDIKKNSLLLEQLGAKKTISYVELKAQILDEINKLRKKIEHTAELIDGLGVRSV